MQVGRRRDTHYPSAAPASFLRAFCGSPQDRLMTRVHARARSVRMHACEVTRIHNFLSSTAKRNKEIVNNVTKR